MTRISCRLWPNSPRCSQRLSLGWVWSGCVDLAMAKEGAARYGTPGGLASGHAACSDFWCSSGSGRHPAAQSASNHPGGPSHPAGCGMVAGTSATAISTRATVVGCCFTQSLCLFGYRCGLLSFRLPAPTATTVRSHRPIQSWSAFCGTGGAVVVIRGSTVAHASHHHDTTESADAGGG